MIKELMHDPIFLSMKSEVATKEDLPAFFVLSFSGFTAKIIQHKIDHCNGVLI